MAVKLEFEENPHYIKGLEELLTTDASFSKELDKMIFAALGKAREGLKANALASIRNGDPRESVRSIRRSVFKAIRGGAVGILNKPNKGQFQRTGQSARTQKINSYTGEDRAFILRFLNSGTGDRVGGFGRNYKMDSATLYSHKGRSGWRGQISPRNFMQQSYIDRALLELESDIMNYIDQKTKQ